MSVVTALRLAARHFRHEWSVRPRSTVLFVVLVPASIAVLYTIGLGDWALLVNFGFMFWLGWNGQTVWLRSGKVSMVVREWVCVQEGCGYRLRVVFPPAGRVTFAEHLREAHGIEAVPDDLDHG